MKRSRKQKRSSFTTLRGVVLSVSIGALFILVFLFVYYLYMVPMQRSVP